MVSIVPSRFAVLKIEDDDEPKNNKKSPKPSKEPPKPEAKKKQKKSQKPKQRSTELEKQQWEEWRERDEELVNQYFEKDLEAALLLSKVEFEATKDTMPNEMLPTTNGIATGASKKSKTVAKPKKVSLQQFLDQSAGAGAMANTDPDPPKSDESDFFAKVNAEAKKIIRKEENALKPGSFYLDDASSRSVSESRSEIATVSLEEFENLKEENETFKEEIKELKERIRKLNSVLKQVHLKEKIDLMVENKNLKKIQEELMTELSSLHMELEKSKSLEVKSAKKTLRFDVSSEIPHH